MEYGWFSLVIVFFFFFTELQVTSVLTVYILSAQAYVCIANHIYIAKSFN